MPVKIELELTANQRSLLLSALLYYKRCYIEDNSPSLASLDLEDTEAVIKKVAATPCGDPGCSICGDATLTADYTEWDHQVYPASQGDTPHWSATWRLEPDSSS